MTSNLLLRARRVAARVPRPGLGTAAELAGMAAVAHGAGEVYGPAGWIVAGVFLLLIGNR